MMHQRPRPLQADPAVQAQLRMQGRGKRRLVKHILERNARWRRLVARTMTALMAAVLAGQLALGEQAALAAVEPDRPAPVLAA
ncbi:hypothetical protein [Massilia consociata]|uniref:Uncharacterized protein n=1 Tax=Massilia consociata TaxID=760117 RepID=A0ABV6FAM2_9BURK